MLEQKLHLLDSITELLQYHTSGAVTFAATDNSLAATGIGTSTFAVGDYIVVGGSSQAANNTTHKLATVSANKITVTPDTSITDDNAGETITLNQEYQGEWLDVRRWPKLVGTINCSGNAYLYIDQSASPVGANTDYTTTVTVTGGTAAAFSVETVLPYARIRVRNNGADQTIMRAYLYGRSLT